MGGAKEKRTKFSGWRERRRAASKKGIRYTSHTVKRPEYIEKRAQIMKGREKFGSRVYFAPLDSFGRTFELCSLVRSVARSRDK